MTERLFELIKANPDVPVMIATAKRAHEVWGCNISQIGNCTVKEVVFVPTEDGEEEPYMVYERGLEADALIEEYAKAHGKPLHWQKVIMVETSKWDDFDTLES